MDPQLSCGSIDSSTNLPYLPPEIKTLVAKYLVKSDLKNLRSVAKAWSANATPLLFDRAYISPYDKDIQVFANITQNPTFASSIKDLIFDISSVPKLSYGNYFDQLRREIRSITAHPDRPFSYYSSSRQRNQFVNDITQHGRDTDLLLSKYGKERLLVEGFRLWQQLTAQEQHNLGGGVYFNALSAGLRRLPNLQAVKIDNAIWKRNRLHTSILWAPLCLEDALKPYHVLGVEYSGSPLSRSWNPWHLRPKRSEYEPENSEPRSLDLVMRALSSTKRRIKRFQYDPSPFYEGLSPMLFSRHKITDRFPRHMAIALCQLELLELKITACEYQLVGHGSVDPLGFLPQLLEQIKSLKRLTLNLETAERVTQWRDNPPNQQLDDSCLSYSQVFPRQGRWPHLEMFSLRGLAIDGLDLLVLVISQMPNLRRLWLNRIDLLGARWEGIVEAMRLLGPWELFSLQENFRHQDRQWWPCSPEYEEEEYARLNEFMRYISEGGRHPSLPPGSPDGLGRWFFIQMLIEASEERRRTFLRRIKKLRQQ